MNNSQRFCWVRYSGTMFSSRASETSTKSPMVPRSFSRASVTLGDSMVGWRHRKEARDGLLPNRLASDKPCEARKSPGAA